MHCGILPLMTPTLTADQVRHLRTRAQHLTPGDSGTTVAEVVQVCAGMQAQEAPAAALAVRARSQGLTAAGVEAARVAARAVVRTWAMRGTLHLVATADLGWLLALLG